MPFILIRGRQVSYLDTLFIGRRKYFLLEQFGQDERESYKAFDPRSGPGGQYFLVRRLPRDSSEQQLRVLARLKVQCLPRVWEWQRNRDQIDVVLTWFDGFPLNVALQHIADQRRPPMDPGHVVRLISGLVQDLSFLHRKLQIVHGDLQPANLLISDHPSRLHLIDFGSAWTTDWGTRRSDGDGHHRSYAAPELQSTAGRPTPACDQFAAAVIAFQLLTQSIPWGGLGGKAGRPEFMTRVSSTVLKPPSQISSECRRLPDSLRKALDDLIRTSLALEPARRINNSLDWQNRWRDLWQMFRQPPAVSPGAIWLTRVIDWFEHRTR